MGAYHLANNQKLSNRSKHYFIKYHHFWEAVKQGTVKVSKICTTLQNADYLTKGLPKEVFLANRHRVQGWPAKMEPITNDFGSESNCVSGPQCERESQDPTSSQGPLVTELPLGDEGHALPGVPNSAHSGPLNGYDQKSN